METRTRRMAALTCLLLTMALVPMEAQTQAGVVRTIGRPGQPGIPLAHVTIRVKGRQNAIVSSGKGEFHITLSGMEEGDPIVLQQVQKNGYILKDADLIGRPLPFSTQVPIEIVMISIRQLEADRKRIEDNAYKRAEHHYREKAAELERKRKNKEMSAGKYRQELQILQEKYEKYMSLIGDMANRYARTDYDRLDSVDYQINICIENGDLDKADSLIHTVFDPETVLQRNRAAKEEVMQRMAFAQSIIDKAHQDMEAIGRDMDYAKRIAALSDILAEAYQENGSLEKAAECLEGSLPVKKLLYGEDSNEVTTTIQEIKILKQ